MRKGNDALIQKKKAGRGKGSKTRWSLKSLECQAGSHQVRKIGRRDLIPKWLGRDCYKELLCLE